MAESRLQRWARKKAEASKETSKEASKESELGSSSASALPSTIEPQPSPEEQELAINEALPEQGVLEKYGLPDPDAIELGTDITGFMRKEIPELLRRRALRSLWKSNPVLAVLDGLNDYDEDFTDAANAGKIVKTLYQVGQGFDRTPQVEEKADEQIKDQTQEKAEVDETVTEDVPERVAEGVAEKVPERVTERVTEKSELEPVIAETQPAPRYRPRMRFNY